jgi:hypothetical protein
MGFFQDLFIDGGKKRLILSIVNFLKQICLLSQWSFQFLQHSAETPRMTQNCMCGFHWPPGVAEHYRCGCTTKEVMLSTVKINLKIKTDV